MDAIEEAASATEQTSRHVTLQPDNENDNTMVVEDLEGSRSRFEKDSGPATRENTFGFSTREEKPLQESHALGENSYE